MDFKKLARFAVITGLLLLCYGGFKYLWAGHLAEQRAVAGAHGGWGGVGPMDSAVASAWMLEYRDVIRQRPPADHKF